MPDPGLHPTVRRAPARLRSTPLRASLALLAALALAACDGKLSRPDAPPSPRLALNTGAAATFSVSATPFGWSPGLGTGFFQWHAVSATPSWAGTIYNTGDLQGIVSFQVKDAAGVFISDNTLHTRGAVWSSSDTTVATVKRYKDPVVAQHDRFDGDVKVKKGGTVTLTLTLDPSDTAKRKSMSITLVITDQRPVTVARIGIDPTSAALQVGQTRRFKVTAYDAANNPYTPVVQVGFTGTPNLTLVRVNNYEVDVTASSGGTGTVTASAYTFTTSATITTPGALAALNLAHAQGNQIVDGGCTVFSATRVDAAGTATTQGGPITWTLGNPAVATITPSGDGATVCASAGTSPGTTTVTATAGSVSSSLTVRHWRVASITLSPASISVTGPTATTVNATVMGDLGAGPVVMQQSATSPGVNLSWSSDNTAIATVSGSPRSATVNTMNQSGSTTVRATVGGVTATLPVSVTGLLSVSVWGPDYITTKGTYRWQAYPTGGVGSYSYVWEKSTDGGSTWSMLLSTQYSYPIYGPIAELYIGCGSQTLRYRVRVTSSADGQVAYGYRTTYANVGSYPYGTSC